MKKNKILYLFLALAFILPSGHAFAKEINRSLYFDEINRAPVLEYIDYKEDFLYFQILFMKKNFIGECIDIIIGMKVIYTIEAR